MVFRKLQVRTVPPQAGDATRREAPLPRSGLVPLPTQSDTQVAARWHEQHLAWILLVSVALGSGAFAGVFGCLLRTAWLGRSQVRSARRVRPR